MLRRPAALTCLALLAACSSAGTSGPVLGAGGTASGARAAAAPTAAGVAGAAAPAAPDGGTSTSSPGASGVTFTASAPSVLGDRTGGSVPTSSGAGPSGASSPDAPSPGPSAPPATAVEGDASDEAADVPGLVLEVGGLGVLTADTHLTHLEFGASARHVRATVSRLVGPLSTLRRDCAAGPRTVSATRGLQLVAHGDHFVGWSDRGSTGRHLSTVDGIAVGMTVAELTGAGTDATVRRRGTGGATWTATGGGLSGRASSAAPGGRVTLVSSGETC